MRTYDNLLIDGFFLRKRKKKSKVGFRCLIIKNGHQFLQGRVVGRQGDSMFGERKGCDEAGQALGSDQLASYATSELMAY